MIRILKFMIGMCLFVFSLHAVSEQTKPEKVSKRLPDPLTLDHALSLADTQHPDILLQDAKVREAKAHQEAVDSANAFHAYLDVASYAIDEDSQEFARRMDHNRAGIVISKTFYDFGHKSDLMGAAEQKILSQQLELLDARGRKRLEIMHAFFDVLLADIKFNQYNEAMAMGFIHLDRAQNRKELGRETDVKIAELQVEYQKIRGLRAHSENQQRETRAKLAEVLNYPNQLPANLVTPKLSNLRKKLPEIETLQKQASEKNLKLQSLRHQLRSAEQELEASRNADNPTIQAYVRAHEYDSVLGNTDEISGELSITYDLYNPRHGANTAEKLSTVYAARANLQKAESDLRQTILSLWHKIEELKLKQDEAQAFLEYREIYLERNRALYEMEVSTDLGTSMSELTRAIHISAQTDYQLAMAWYQMDLLTSNVQMDTELTIKQPEQ